MAEELLKIEHLTKKYEENIILNDVGLTVHKGEVIVIVGPSGCGKSTFLRCINALEPIQGGTIVLDGENVETGNRNLARVREKIGMVFQNYELFPHLTISENIMLAPIKVQKRKKETVKRGNALTAAGWPGGKSRQLSEAALRRAETAFRNCQGIMYASGNPSV